MGQIARPKLRGGGYPELLSNGALAVDDTPGILIAPALTLMISAVPAE